MNISVRSGAPGRGKVTRALEYIAGDGFLSALPKVYWTQDDGAECVCGIADGQQEPEICKEYAPSPDACNTCGTLYLAAKEKRIVASLPHARPTVCGSCGHCMLCHGRPVAERSPFDVDKWRRIAGATARGDLDEADRLDKSERAKERGPRYRFDQEKGEFVEE